MPEAATVRAGGCNRTFWRLQPFLPRAATAWVVVVRVAVRNGAPRHARRSHYYYYYHHYHHYYYYYYYDYYYNYYDSSSSSYYYYGVRLTASRTTSGLCASACAKSGPSSGATWSGGSLDR